VEILDPTTRPDRTEAVAPCERPATLEGKRLGLLDNGKRNSRRVLVHLAAVIGAAYPLADLVLRTKPSASRAAPPEMLAELTSACDVVISGIGD